MKAEELAAIREDVQQAILEAHDHDPTVALEILWRLFDEVGKVATISSAGNRWPFAWSVDLLRDVQTRAVSKIPWGEPTHDDEPEDHR